MKKPKLILALWLFCIIASCKGSDNNYPLSPITDQKLRDAVNFKQGSYFVYVDSASGIVDSLGIVTYDSSIIPDANAKVNYENIGFRAFDNNNIGYGIAAINNSVNGSYANSDNGFTNFRVITLPFKEGSTEVAFGNVTFNYIKHIPSYTVLGKIYEDVYEIDSRYEDRSFYTWYSAVGGLIRFKYERGTDVHV